MAYVVMGTHPKSMPKLDGSLKGKVLDFLQKIQINDATPGLHIEPIRNSADSRVRTGRVDLKFRAVLFRVDSSAGDTYYLYLGTWPHDDAIAMAAKSVLRVNPVNNVLEAILGGTNGKAERQRRSVVPDRTGQLSRIITGALPYLTKVGFTLADLVECLGLPEDVAERALAAADDYAINELAAEVGGWQGNALLELACGTSIDDIREKLGFTSSRIDRTLGENDQIIDALDNPASQMQFTLIDSNDELRRVLEGGDFAAWRTFLHPQQRAYVARDFSGPFRLSGGAGTGKTVVAIHRARMLAKRDPNARIILTTYNKTLAMGLEADLRVLDPELRIAQRPGDPGVYVAGIDKLAGAVLHMATDLTAALEVLFGPARRGVSPKRTRTDHVWRAVAKSVRSGLEPRLANPGFLEREYVSVVLANRVTTVDQYAKVARAGRGVRLNRAQRLSVWMLVEAFRQKSRDDGSLSFPEVLAVAAEYLQHRVTAGQPFLADHVLVDEAQDLHATHWALLRALAADGPNDLFIAEDSHQRIYGQPVVLSRFGIKIVGRARRLTLNYRTTAQNLHFAVNILTGGDYHDLEQGEESTNGYRSARLGPNPQQIECYTATEQFDRITDLVWQWLNEGVDPGTVAVLTRGQQDRDEFVTALVQRDIKAQALEGNPAAPGVVQVLTMHRSKGMEFSRVILAGVGETHMSAAGGMRAVLEEEREEAMLRERSLLYVAASRARDELVVTWNGKKSELLG
ncbi:AAA family ATPase [Nocardia sp. SYP-A9097]|uniref:3'-5' exonuclease n=1 Tax=Nocardia sp. SYP-A9097 TaxID=2663237 RepID=UPI00129B7222|nr:3'-5' exonuclease [Nocardia sp. SYP-A9097]MRH92812.1 AAA family ATPase [Nocardia sp. SYP-A9097]